MNYAELHHEKPLVVFNTLGMTGVELLLADLCMCPQLLVLPGQNFIECEKRLYRPHAYNGHGEEALFQSLSLIQQTKSGMTWAGLTKFFSKEDFARYDQQKHKASFSDKIKSNPQYKDYFFDLASSYVETFFTSCGLNIANVKTLGFYSGNVALNTPLTGRISDRVAFVHLNPSIDIWLTLISRTKTWNPVSSIKFWIVNQLFLMLFSENQKKFLLLDYSKPLTGDVLAEIRHCVLRFLSLNDPGSATLAKEEQVIRAMGHMDPQKVKHDDIVENSAKFEKIHSSCPFYALAKTIKQWGPEFLQDASNQALLRRFQSFWQTSSHTNFDWIGPVADALIAKALNKQGHHQAAQSADDLNINYLFYHAYSKLDSDHHDLPQAFLEHYLGDLENEIVIPKLPYHLKICIEYLRSTVRNYQKHLHSYFPVRRTYIYQQLTRPEYQARMKPFGLTTHFSALESEIDALEQSLERRLFEFTQF